MAETPETIVEAALRRLETDPEYRREFQQGVIGKLVLEELFKLRDQVNALRKELEAGGANGNLADELAQARARITELEGQLSGRGESQEGEDEHLPFWDIVTAEIERLPKQTVAALDAEADRLLRHRAGGMLSAHLRGDFSRPEFRKRLKNQLLQEIAQGKAVAVRPTPAPAGASSSAARNQGPMD
ncbi:MAG: hypothetical protein WAP74_02745 [Patescibacteria group bacterium]